MNLFDPSRPKVGHRPAFAHGMSAIPKLYIFPLGNNLVEITALLPLASEKLTGKWFRVEVSIEKLPELMQQFTFDPEDLFLNLFQMENGFVPMIATEPDIKLWAKEQKLNRENDSKTSALPSAVDLFAEL